jgi:type III pantothenate kinase
VEIAKPERVIGKNTIQAMQSGLFYGYVGQVDGILERLLKEQPGSTIVATGGLAKALAAESKIIKHLEPDLTLDGLKILWLKNRR